MAQRILECCAAKPRAGGLGSCRKRVIPAASARYCKGHPTRKERTIAKTSSRPIARLWAGLLARLYNWHRVDAGVFRSAQMYGDHAALLLTVRNIRTLVNLRGENARSGWYNNERAACDAVGAAFVDVQLSSKRLPEREDLLSLLAALDGATRPVLMKCSGGADRTGFAAGLYLLHAHGAGALSRARRQMARWPYFHWPKKHQRWIAAFFDFYEADAKGRPVADWLAEAYTAERFADFLRGRGQGDYWKP